jgi:glucan biosynthesis protein C
LVAATGHSTNRSTSFARSCRTAHQLGVSAPHRHWHAHTRPAELAQADSQERGIQGGGDHGFLIVADDRYDTAIVRHRWAALGLAALMVVTVLVAGLPSQWTVLGAAATTAESMLTALAGWFSLVAVLGFGRKHLSVADSSLRYAGEAVLPFYILHQPVIVMLGYVVRAWELSIGAKYTIVLVVGFAVLVLVYELAVRRHNSLRFLFGMRPLPAGHPARQPAALG